MCVAPWFSGPVISFLSSSQRCQGNFFEGSSALKFQSRQFQYRLFCSSLNNDGKVLIRNTWDKDDKSGTFCLGCGPQEEFYNCADISVSKNDNIEDSKETIPTNKPVKVDSPSDNKGTKAPNVIRYTEKVKSPPATSKISPSRNVKATSTTQLVNTPTEQVLVLKIPHSVQNEIGTIPTVKQGVSMALEKLKLENMWKSTIDIITEGSTKSIGKTEQAKAKDGELFRGMKWWTASPVAKETTTFPWTYATKPTTTAITVQADNKQIVKPGRRPDSLSPFANSWAWQYSWIKSNFIFDDDHRKANRTNSNDIIKEIFSTKPKPKASSTTVSTDDFVSAYGNLHATPTPVVTRKSKNSPSQRSKTPNWLKTSLHPSLPGDLSYLVTRSGRDDDGNEYKSFESEPDEVADLIYEFIDGKRRGYPEDESQQYVSVEAEIQHHNHPDTEEADIHHNHNHPKSDIKTIYRGPYRCPPTQKAPPTNNWQDGSSYKNKPTNPRDQNRYWSPPVYQTWPSTRRTLNCRARIRFSGGMDEWCDINCNANFCPPSFCICEKIFDKSQYETAYPQPIRESWNAYKKPMHVKRLPWEHQYIEKTQQKSWTYKRPEASVFSKGVGSFLSKKYNRIGHDQKVNIRENIVETNFPEVKTKRKRKICVAIGRYSGQSQYDNWCELNCSARFCPPLFCKCYLSY